jgi:regulator of sigma E protease
VSALFDSVETIVLFIVVLGGIVLFHEFGHFVTARIARVRVLEFGVGFPPRAKVLGTGRTDPRDTAWWEEERRRILLQAQGDPDAVAAVEAIEPPKGTEYTLNWLPIGGFVKLEGEDGDAETNPRSFVRARLPIKLLILVAGVFMNLILAMGIFTAIAWLATPYLGVRFGVVDAGSPAEAAGLVGGDALISLNGREYDFFAPYAGGTILTDLRAKAGKTVTLGILHADGTRTQVNVTLRTQADIDAGKGALGIRVTPGGQFESVFLPESTGRPLGNAVSIGVQETFRWFGLILSGLGDLGRSIVNNPTAAPPVSGPVGIATSLGDVFRNSGPIMTLYVAGILSANLALVNFLPFPPLDGGRMLVLLLKAIPRYGAKISLRAERLTYAIGFLALFGFLIWVTVFDLIRQVGGTPTP